MPHVHLTSYLNRHCVYNQPWAAEHILTCGICVTSFRLLRRGVEGSCMPLSSSMQSQSAPWSRSNIVSLAQHCLLLPCEYKRRIILLFFTVLTLKHSHGCLL